MDQFNDTDVNMEENPLPYTHPSLPLQKIAAKQIAVLLWRHKIHNIHLDAGRLSIIPKWLREQKFDVDNLRVPTVMANAIKKSTNEYCSRIIKWLEDHRYTVFRNIFDHDIIVRFINYIDSDSDKVVAGKLLDSDVLSPEEKYKLACKYCFKNYIEQFWPAVSNNLRITGVLYGSNPVLYYWNCAMMKVAPEGLPGDSSYSIEFRMISDPELTDWLAVEYFWHELNAEERSLILASDVTVLKRGKKVIMSVLPNLNKNELNDIQGELLGNVLGCLGTQPMYFEYVLQIWDYYCSFGDLFRSGDTFNVIYLMVFGGAANFTSEEGRQLSVVLYQLWIRAPDKFRLEFTSANQAENFFIRLSNVRPDVAKFYGRDMRFLLEILRTVELPVRNEIWRKYWRNLVVFAEPSYLVEFMELCFNNNDEKIRFRESVMMNFDKLKDEFEEFIKSGYSKQLTNYIKFCSSNQQRVENLRRRIIASCLSLISTPYLISKYIEKINEFISDTFSTKNEVQDDFAKKFRADYFLASENRVLSVLRDELDKGCLSYAVRLCNSLITELCPTRVKCDLLDHLKKLMFSCNFTQFKISEWDKFVTWCAGSIENVRSFKQSIPVGDIFDELLAKIIDRLRRARHFNPYESSMRGFISNGYGNRNHTTFLHVDNFLMWYFNDNQAVTDFKIAKFSDDRVVRIIELVPEKRAVCVDTVLEWIYGNDKVKINDFKVKYFGDVNISGSSKMVRKRRLSKSAPSRASKISKML